MEWKGMDEKYRPPRTEGLIKAWKMKIYLEEGDGRVGKTLSIQPALFSLFSHDISKLEYIKHFPTFSPQKYHKYFLGGEEREILEKFYRTITVNYTKAIWSSREGTGGFISPHQNNKPELNQLYCKQLYRFGRNKKGGVPKCAMMLYSLCF